MQLAIANSNVPAHRPLPLADILSLEARVCLRPPVSGLVRARANATGWDGISPCIVKARYRNPRHPAGEMTVTICHNGKR